MRYRVGRHNPRIVYRQQADEPSDSDDMMATFFDAIDAIAVVQLLNGEVEESAPLESPAAAALRWYAMHDHGGGMRHQHFPANAGHGSHDGVRLELHRPAAADEPASDRCPSCESPEPCLHPATQAEGEVSRICPDPFHRAAADEPAPVPPPVDALPPLPPKWTRPSATEAHNIANVLAAPQHTVPAHDYWDERPFVAWQAAAIQQVMYRAIDDAWAAGVEEGHGLLDRAVVQEIEQRERAEEIADKLTAAIGRHLGVDFGEHSNANDPWGNALIALAEADGGKFVKAAHEDGVTEGRRQRDAEIAASVFASAREVAAEAGFGPVPDSVTVSYLTTDVRARVLTEAYWKLREHASALRSTEVYRKASERKEGTLRESPAFQRYRWLEATARGIEDGARDLAEMLDVPEHEIERPGAVDHG